jgi:hypothetical protein
MSDPNSRRTIGYLMLAGALVMGVLAALFRAEVIVDAGASQNAVWLVLGGVAAVDTVIGAVLIVKS